jgi:radical SAM superfamily enzyme YgiQ (UPF0313 family)
MKIVFVQPNVGFKGHTWEALGVGYIISYLRQNSGHEHEISFYSAFYDSDESIVDACSDADVIAFTCTSPQYRHGLSLAGRVKTEANKVVFGGVHPSALPHDVVKEPCIDAVVQGEGERSMLRIVDEMEADHALSRTIYNSAYIEDLNAVPFPDRKTIKNERNIDQAYRDNGSRITSVLSSRGCPYRCSFCCSSVVWKRVVRFRSPGNILDEFEDVQRDYKIQFIKFADDTFTVKKNEFSTSAIRNSNVVLPSRTAQMRI